MAAGNKKRIKWRGLATFTLVLGILVEIVSGIVLYITPLGRTANWTNWTLMGLDKHEWTAIHTVFGYLLFIIIGLHLYFNWRIIKHFFWSKLHHSFNLKREFAIASAIILIVFAGTFWGVPPFSSIMDLGRSAKLSWETNSDGYNGRGSRWAQTTHSEGEGIGSRQGGGRWLTNQIDHKGYDLNQSGFGPGGGRNNQFNSGQYNNEQSARRSQSRGRHLNQNNTARAETRLNSSDELKGRDFVRMGDVKAVTGSLMQKGDEWELKADDLTYEIHMAQRFLATPKAWF